MKKKFTNLYLENQLCFPLYAASRLTTKLYAPHLKKLDITYPQYLVLLILWEHQTQSVSEIGQQLMLESNTLTPLLKRLEQKEIIQRNRSNKDERTVIISLTKAGENLKEQAAVIPEKIMGSFRDDNISDTEVAAFEKTLLSLVKILKEKSTKNEE
ncbi:MarR family winged helix-turn-helix transcriptional regulator [Crocinitomix catalasitica]|uniref:MarR family winged helix-turn-helix transcriptional regulator n=1 Tax=Crocinitomix catalasitica TaxID=184607 RepID=UPI00048499E3|nr:MarR family transcriptional regulator [Crocinitomix catalasitica]|tara:strand:- start:160 stop:627 length:468 start_codon:yes stop_codon:yes gene_type:complete